MSDTTDLSDPGVAPRPPDYLTAHNSGLRMRVEETDDQLLVTITCEDMPPLPVGSFARQPDAPTTEEYYRLQGLLPALLLYLNRGGQMASLWQYLTLLQDVPPMLSPYRLAAVDDGHPITVWQRTTDDYLVVYEGLFCDELTEAQFRKSFDGHYIDNAS